MNVQSKNLAEAVKQWENIPTFMEDQDSDHGAIRIEIIDFVFDFQCFYGRGSTKTVTSKESKAEYWIDQVDRCELDLVSPRVIYWSSKGRVTRIKITPPSDEKKLDSLKFWKVLVFHDYHQLMPSVYSADEFIKNEGCYIVFWYAVWRKWPLKYKVWEFAGDPSIVPFTQKECPTSIKQKEKYLTKYPTKMQVTSFASWELFDGEKNDLKRLECIRGYCKNDPEMAVQLTLEVQKGNWILDQIKNWNSGVMNHDGSLDEELLKRLKYGPYVYGDDKMVEVGKLMKEWDDDSE